MAEFKSTRPRPKNFTDLTGQRFGYLTVIELSAQRPHKWKPMWLCQCDYNGCTNTTLIRTANLTNSRTRTCGCLQRDVAKDAHTTHGLHGTSAYRKWKSAKDRCFRKKCPNYSDYGGRGITMCEEWKNSFEAFFRDMGPCPDGMTIERINVNGNYEPTNCIWASMMDQAKNKRNSVYVTVNGETIRLVDLANKTGIADYTLRRRLKRGDPLV